MLFLTTGVEEPASRFRVLQFLSHFERMGITCTSRSAYGLRYNAISRTRLGTPYKAVCRAKRVLHTVRAGGYDVLFLQRTALPTSALAERIASWRNPRIVFDYDDSIFLEPNGQHDGPRAKAFHAAVGLSARVVAGNQFLAAAARAPAKTEVIPTVVDTDQYRPSEQPRSADRLVIGWMGTSTNFVYLTQLVPAIERLLAELPHAVFRIVANSVFEGLAEHPRVEQVPWSESNELAELQGFDIGLMPLLDTDLARGKCGFKMIQYMSVGAPVLSSAVGANIEILEGSGAGRLIAPGADWYGPLLELAMDAERRREMGLLARRRVVEDYSVESVLPRYAALFESVASTQRRR